MPSPFKLKMMKKEDYILSVQGLFDWLCACCGYDWNKIMAEKNFKGTFGSYGTQKSLFKIWSYIQKKDAFLAWELAIGLIEEMITERCVKNPSDVGEIRSHATFLYDASGYIENYQLVKQADRAQWNTFLQSFSLLTMDEKKNSDLVDTCPRSLQMEVDNILLKPRLLRICRYKGNGQLQLDKLNGWMIGENFIMAEEVSSLFFLNRAGTDGVLKIYVTLNIEQHLDYSYFLIAINQGENWWMVTDEAEFANPSAKEGIAYRGAARFRENNFEMSIFPYCYLDKIEQERVQNKQIEKGDGLHREMYTVPLKEWPVQCRVMLELLLHEVVRKIAEQGSSIEEMKFGSDFMSTDHLLTGKVESVSFDELDKDFEYSERSGYMRERVKEMILREDKQSALVKIDHEKFRSNLSLFAGSLMTEDKYRKLQAWALCKEDYEMRKKSLVMTDEEKRDDIQTYNRLFDHNIHNCFDMLFAAREMWVFIYEPDVEYGEANVFNCKQKVMLTGLHYDVYWPLAHSRTAGGMIGDTCRCCNRHPLKEQHTSGIRVTHWSMLAWLAGVAREQLPFYFCNYASDGFHTYIGNTLLNNINPLYALKDEMSNRYTTGFHLGIRMCKRCRNAYAKKAFEKGVLVINKNTCQAEGVFTMEDFKENWLPSKGIQCTQIVKQL